MKIERFATVRHWCLMGLFNLLLVAGLGTLMRLEHVNPFLGQWSTNLLHAHSHFAFLGWVSGMLMLLITCANFGLKAKDYLPMHQRRVLVAHSLVSYASLLSFLVSGYSVISIVLSALSVLISYWYVYLSWIDLRRGTLHTAVKRWFGASFACLVLSSFGTFYLARLMSSGMEQLQAQRAAIEFYLHFQYNGWFFFTLMGLLADFLHTKRVQVNLSKLLFLVMLLAVFPTYLLSISWIPMHPAFRYVAGCAALAQLVCTMAYGWRIQKQSSGLLRCITPDFRIIWRVIGGALLVKLTVQMLSAIPSFSHLTFGFRPVTIAYLHLVLLVIVSGCLLLYLFQSNYLLASREASRYLSLFFWGAVVNEMVLMIQIAFSVAGSSWTKAPWALASVSLTMVLGLAGTWYTQSRWSVKRDHFPYEFNR